MPVSRALAIATAILKILHSCVSAQTPTCLPGYNWTFNSLGESPCNMTRSLGLVCYPGGFDMSQLAPNGSGYSWNDYDQCMCSTVFYSLMSACVYCQNSTFPSWSAYEAPCTTIYDQIAHSIVDCGSSLCLSGCSGNTFNVTAASSAGGPETTPVPQTTIAPQTTIGAPSTSTNPTTVIPTPISVTSTPTGPTTSAASTPTPPTVAATSNTGAIVGGVVAGLAIIVAGVIAIVFLRRQKPPA